MVKYRVELGLGTLDGGHEFSNESDNPHDAWRAYMAAIRLSPRPATSEEYRRNIKIYRDGKPISGLQLANDYRSLLSGSLKVLVSNTQDSC